MLGGVFGYYGCILVLWKLLWVSHCVVKWVLFSVLSILLLRHCPVHPETILLKKTAMLDGIETLLLGHSLRHSKVHVTVYKFFLPLN